MQIFRFSDNLAIRTKIIPNYLSYYQSRFHFQLFGNYPMVTLRSEPLQQGQWRFVKRLFDIGFSILAFILLFSWLFPLIALLIKLDSRGPVFFRQARWGKNGEKFMCYKFRSMKPESRDVNERNEFQQAHAKDPRITKLGALLRRTSLDELPQFLNVLMGDMSVVGPRPHAHEHNLRTKDQVGSYMVRHWIKPGVTGWAQVNGYRGETRTIDQMRSRVDFDIWYIENWTFWLDIRIIIMTVYNIIRGEDNAY
jgi:putative colanic acid biosynthesis UDP-glucose lipid carrier transferase